MNFVTLKQKATECFAEAPFICRIHNEAEYEQALALMDELVKEYDKYLALIEAPSASIEKWADQAAYFSAFNRRIAALDDDVAVLRTLMDQHQLKADDLKDEIGGKSLVSMILNGARKLTRAHIQALSGRFKISPAGFFRGA